MNWRNAVCIALIILCIDGETARAELVAVEFPVPAGVQGTEEAECIAAPNFSSNIQRSEVYDAIKVLMGKDRMVTLLRSSTLEVLERRGTGIEGLWEKAHDFKNASCVSKCILLPVGTKLSRLRFTDEDGLTECLRTGLRSHLPSISDVSCGSTVWRDIIVATRSDNEQMLCATAVAWLTIPRNRKESEMPTTKNRIFLEYETSP